MSLFDDSSAKGSKSSFHKELNFPQGTSYYNDVILVADYEFLFHPFVDPYAEFQAQVWQLLL